MYCSSIARVSYTDYVNLLLSSTVHLNVCECVCVCVCVCACACACVCVCECVVINLYVIH